MLSILTGRRSFGSLMACVGAILVACAAVGCDKVPLLAPSGTTITLGTDSSIVQSNGVARVTATLLESSGTPVQNGTTVTFSTNFGRISPTEARTLNGVATAEFQAIGNSGVAEIRATSGGAKPADAANSTLKITVGAAAAGRISITAAPGSVSPNGGTSNVSASVADASGNPLRGLPVTFTTTAGTLSTAVASTDANGIATTTLTTNREATVTASTGAGATAGKDTANVVVRISPKPTVSISTVGTATGGTTTNFTVTATAVTGAPPIENVRVDFGDGTTPVDLGGITGPTPVQHLYSRAGTYTANATAVDAAGISASASTVVVVPFALTLSSSRTGSTGNFTANVNPPNTAISSFVWNFGDGDGKTTSSNQTSHDYLAPGTYSVSVTATSSGNGQTATSAGTIVIP